MGSLEFSENQLRLYVRTNQCATRASSASASPNCSPPADEKQQPQQQKLQNGNSLARVACDPVRVRLRRAFVKWCVEEQRELVSEAPRETASDFVTPLVTPYSSIKCSASASASPFAERNGAEAPEEKPVLVCAAARRLNIDGDADGDGGEERSAAPARKGCGKYPSNLTPDPTSPCKLSKP